MTEIPDHLMKRASEARKGAERPSVSPAGRVMAERIQRDQWIEEGRLRERKEIAQRAARLASGAGGELNVTLVESTLAALDEIVKERTKAINDYAKEQIKDSIDSGVGWSLMATLVLVPVTVFYGLVLAGAPRPAALIGTAWVSALWAVRSRRSDIRRLAKLSKWTHLEVQRKVTGEDS